MSITLKDGMVYTIPLILVHHLQLNFSEESQYGIQGLVK
jgi:hypothetical protein